MEQFISKILVNLSRLSTFPKYRNYRELSVPFGISFRSDRHTRVQFPASLSDVEGKMTEL